MKSVLFAFFLWGVTIFSARSEPELIVHEWGTFTCLQDEDGKAIGGINTDDEPVPSFVYDAAPGLLFPAEEPPPTAKGGVRRCHSQVTMRLETPVVYFYPAEGFEKRLNVRASFKGGWLTQYFPRAKMEAFGLKPDGTGFLDFARGFLNWSGISLSMSDEGPATNSLVWTTPRQVDAATIEVAGEHEKFLFYRGVGQLEAPVRVVRHEAEFIITRDRPDRRADEIHQLWLADIRADGTGAFRVLEPFTEETAFLVKTASTFAPEDYSADAIKRLRDVMRKALIAAGLFEKEANAMLNTWQASYFKSPGLRLFFLVPRAWTDQMLPLTVSPARKDLRSERPELATELTRVMVGRVEIVTPQQRATLARIASAGPENSARAGDSVQAVKDTGWDNLFRSYQTLGRFRNALVLNEQKRNPSPSLEEFVRRYRLEGYTPDFREFGRTYRAYEKY
jgi:hypothetical protein